MLDTGAPLHILPEDVEYKKTLYVYNRLFQDATNKVDTHITVKSDTIQLGNTKFCNFPAIVTEKKEYTLFHLSIEGMIGSNIFKDCKITIDVRNKKLMIFNSKEMLPSKEYRSFMEIDDQCTPYVYLQFGKVKHLMMFDTGNPSLLDIDKDLMKKYFDADDGISILHTGFGVSRGGAFGWAEPEPYHIVQLKDFSYGNAKFASANATVSSGSMSVGSELLNYGVVTLDYANHVFYFVPYSDSLINHSEKITRDISLIQLNNGYRIRTIWNYNFQEKYGIQSLDEVISINDRPAGEVTYDEYSKMFYSDETLSLKIKKYNKEIVDVVLNYNK